MGGAQWEWVGEEQMKACWVWVLQGAELHLRGPSTNRQDPSDTPCSLEEDLESLAQDQRPLARPGGEGGVGATTVGGASVGVKIMFL